MTVAPVLSSLLLESDYNIFTITLDDTEKTYLTSDGQQGSINIESSFSYDGGKIVYTNVKTGDPIASGGLLLAPGHIWSMNADGSDQTQLTVDPLYGALPTYSPDGSTILFTGFATGTPELWQMNADGTDPHPITHTTGSGVAIDGQTITWSTHASYSPDGKKIAYSSTESGHAEIWVMNSDGSDPTEITFPDDPNAPDANNPTWSPDGSKIVFFGGHERDGGYIFSMNPDGSDRTQLTTIHADDPSWSPDGQQIIFDSVASGKAATWIMNADGSDQRVLSDDPHGPSRLAAVFKVEPTDVPDTPSTADVYNLYGDVLGRIPTDDELLFFTSALSAGTLSLSQARDALAHSSEAAKDLSNVFLKAAGRSPDAAELAGMADQLANFDATQSSIIPGGGVTAITAGAGDASLTAISGSPTLFDFSDIDFGNDTVVGFDPTQDAIRLNPSLAASFVAVQSDMSQSGSDTLITLDATHSILLSGIQPSSLTAANFLFA